MEWNWSQPQAAPLLSGTRPLYLSTAKMEQYFGSSEESRTPYRMRREKLACLPDRAFGPRMTGVLERNGAPSALSSSSPRLCQMARPQAWDHTSATCPEA